MPILPAETTLLPYVVTLHVVAMTVGMGVAGIADLLGLGVLFAKLRLPQRVFMLLHFTILVAIFALVFSGGILIVLRSGGWCGLDEARIVHIGASLCVPNKLVAKLVLMTVLGVVALLIDAYLVPLSRRAERPLLAVLSEREIIRISAIATASLTCWTSIATIALVKPLHTWPFLTLLSCSFALWMILATGAAISLFAIRNMMRQGRYPLHAETWGQVRDEALASVRAAARNIVAMPARGAPVGQAYAGNERDEAEIRTFADAVGACRTAIVGTGALSLVINMLMLAGPLYMLQVYDRVMMSRNVETLVVLTVLLISAYAFMAFLEIIRGRILARVALRLDRILGPRLFTSYVERAPAKSDASAHHHPLRDLEQIRQFVAGPVPAAFFDLPWTLPYLLLIFLLHPLLGLVATVGAGVLVALSILTQLLARRPLERAANEVAATHALAEAGRRSSETLRSMAMVGKHRDRWLVEHRGALSQQLKAGDVTASFSAVTRICRLLLQSLLLGTGAYLAVNDAMTAGAMIGASVLAARALAPVEQLIAQGRSVLGFWGAVRRCSDRLQQSKPRQTYLTLPEPAGRVEVNQIYVAQPGRAEPVLKGISFALEPGDALAVLGPSAAGKSTLARALVGLCALRHGEVRLDGAALAQWDPDQLGRYVGYLPQDVTLMQGTVADNIARFDPNPDPKAVIAAAKAADVHETILRMEKGYQTIVGEDGSGLSGGQRQRIGLARALYGKPALIVLDEPNANLDAAGEDALAAAIKRARAARQTVIVMAHRQSILRSVNRVLVINDGRQVAFDATNDFLRKIQPRTERSNARNLSTRKAQIAS